MQFAVEIVKDVPFSSAFHQCVMYNILNLLPYVLMMLNAGVELCLRVRIYSRMNLFIFLPVSRRDMLLSNIQYGRL